MTTRRFRTVLLPAALALATLWGADRTAQAQKGVAAKVTAGKGTLYVGVFPDRFLMIDEATLKITGTIPYISGIPRRTSLARDRSRFYTTEAQMEKVEIIDIPSRKTIDTFTLSEPNKHVRIKSLDPDPLHQYVMMVTRTATKLVDRFEVGPSTLIQYDLKTHSIARTIPWPNGEERENANIQFSPDGKTMYLFSDQDVLIFETTSFKQIDKWELSKPLEEGFARLDFGSTDAVNDEPGFYTGIFTVQDPVNHRRIMGIGRVNLAAKSVDFYTLGPAVGVGFTMAPGRKFGYGLMQEIGRFEFWKFDLEGRRLSRRMEFQGRPRMSLKTSSNGEVLYIYNAGNTIDLYEAATFKYMNTIALDGDMTTDLFVFPPSSAPAKPPAKTTS
jgi:hypothetical protein